MRRSAAASGSGPSSPGSSCAAGRSGIVGLGKIGQAIAVRARAMEMTVLGVDPFVTAEAAANHGVELVDFDELLARADVVTVHVPLTRATRGLIGRDAIAKLKPGSIVLNVARGGVVDEAAVAEALRSGHLGGRRDRRLRRRSRRPTRRCSTPRTRC